MEEQSPAHIEALITSKISQLNLDGRSRERLARTLASVPPRCGVPGAALDAWLHGLSRCHPDVDRACLEAFAEIPSLQPGQSYHLNHLNMALLLLAASMPMHYERALTELSTQAAPAVFEVLAPGRGHTYEEVESEIARGAELFAQSFTASSLALTDRQGRRAELRLEACHKALTLHIARGWMHAWLDTAALPVMATRGGWTDDGLGLIEVVWRVDPGAAAR